MIIYLFALFLLIVFVYSRSINRLKGLPPGPPPLPILGNFLQLHVDQFKNLFEWKAKYGKVYTIWLPHPIVVIADSKLLQEHIVKNGDKFSERINPKNLMNIMNGGEYGLVFNENAMWKEQRRFALHTLRNIGFNNETIQNIAVEYAQEIVSRWKKPAAKGEPVDLSVGIMTGVANIIWHQTFGRTLDFDDPLFKRVGELESKLLYKMGHPLMLGVEIFPFFRHLDSFVGSPIKEVLETKAELWRILHKELDMVEKDLNLDEAPKCFAEAFIGEMRRREAKGEELGTFTQQQLVVACSDLWGAGFETTVTTLRFTFNYLINHPEVQRKAQAEIDKKIGKRNIQMDDQKDLHYCNAVIQEMQRLENLGALGLTRRVSAPVNIEGYDIPVGTGVIPQFSVVHLDENEFERPNYFCPERHINESGEFIKDPRITPFSMGKRACLGEGLARMELFIFFTTFMQHLSFSSVSKIPPPVNVQIGFSRSPAPYKVIIESRD